MKKIILGLLAVTAVAFTSCKDECKDVTCSNGGTCTEGICECPVGYLGSNCETKASDKFEGAWKYNETCDGSSITDYAVSITGASSSPSKIAISGFAGFACGGSNIIVEATVSGNDITVTPSQIFCSTALVINSGTGTLNASGNSITFSYTYTLSGNSGTCSGTYTKI